MTIRTIRYLSEVEASRHPAAATVAMVSIADPGRSVALATGWGALLRVTFADASYTEATIESYGRMWPLSSLNFPTKVHALVIREFLDRLPPTIDTLLVHCGAGVSRSGAVAKYACERFGIDFPENYGRHNEVLYRLLQHPELFDELLARVTARRPSWLQRLFGRT